MHICNAKSYVCVWASHTLALLMAYQCTHTHSLGPHTLSPHTTKGSHKNKEHSHSRGKQMYGLVGQAEREREKQRESEHRHSSNTSLKFFKHFWNFSASRFVVPTIVQWNFCDFSHIHNATENITYTKQAFLVQRHNKLILKPNQVNTTWLIWHLNRQQYLSESVCIWHLSNSPPSPPNTQLPFATLLIKMAAAHQTEFLVKYFNK